MRKMVLRTAAAAAVRPSVNLKSSRSSSKSESRNRCSSRSVPVSATNAIPPTRQYLKNSYRRWDLMKAFIFITHFSRTIGKKCPKMSRL